MGTCCGTPYVKEEDTGSSFSRRSSILFEKFSRLSDYKKNTNSFLFSELEVLVKSDYTEIKNALI